MLGGLVHTRFAEAIPQFARGCCKSAANVGFQRTNCSARCHLRQEDAVSRVSRIAQLIPQILRDTLR